MTPQAVRSVARTLTTVEESAVTLNGAGSSHSCGAEAVFGAITDFEHDADSLVKSVRSLIGGIGTETTGAVSDMEETEESIVEELRQIRFPDQFIDAVPRRPGVGEPGVGRPQRTGGPGVGVPGVGGPGEPRFIDPHVDLNMPGPHNMRYDYRPEEHPMPAGPDGQTETDQSPGVDVPVHNMRYDYRPEEHQGVPPIGTGRLRPTVPRENWGGPYIYRPEEHERPPGMRGPDNNWGDPEIIPLDEARLPARPMMPASDNTADVPRQFDRDHHRNE